MQKDPENITIKKSKIPLYLTLGVLLAGTAAYFFIPEIQNFFKQAWDVLTSNDQHKIEAWVSNFGWFGPLVLILAMVVQMFLIVVPSILLIVVAILAYGPIWGSFISLISVLLASSVGYFIGQYFGIVIVEKLLGRKTEKKIEEFINDYGFWAVIITRINPFLSNDAISFVAGILKMNYWKFITSTLVGIAPLILCVAILEKNMTDLKNGLLWGSIISLLFFIGYIVYDKRKKKC